MHEVARAMDERTERLGKFAAEAELPWAIRALGEVPEDQSERAYWQRRAGLLSAYREITGYSNPADAIGPESGSTNPEFRNLWHTKASRSPRHCCRPASACQRSWRRTARSR
jgi:hypothetical protein